MKIRLTSPTFDASAQTVTHPSFSDVTLAGIQLIVNVTDGIIIYNFADPAKGGILATDTLTLDFDTTGMADADELMVLVEDGVAYPLPTGAATAANQTSILAAVDGIEALLTTIDADTGAILAAVDTLETLVGDTNTKLDTVIGHVDGVEALLTTIDADTGAMATDLAAIEVLATTIEANQDAQTAILTDIETSVQLLDNAISGNEMQVDVVTMPGIVVEDAAETAGGNLMAVGTVRRDTAASSAGTAGDNATLNTDSLGRLWISGAAVEDAAETAGGILLMAGSVRRDTAASSAGTTGDNATINTDSTGALWTRSTGELVDDAAYTLGTNRAVPNGAVAVAMDGTDPLAVSAEGDVAAIRSDPNRILLVNQTHPRFFRASVDYASAQTNATVVAAPGAGLSLYITDIIVSNGATAGNITLLDGSGGSVVLELYPAINGGLTHSFRNPIKLTANTLLACTSTTCTTHAITVTGYIAA